MSYTRWNALRATDGFSATMSRYSQNVPSQCCSRKWLTSSLRSISETSGLVFDGVMALCVHSRYVDHGRRDSSARRRVHSWTTTRPDTIKIGWVGDSREGLSTRDDPRGLPGGWTATSPAGDGRRSRTAGSAVGGTASHASGGKQARELGRRRRQPRLRTATTGGNTTASRNRQHCPADRHRPHKHHARGARFGQFRTHRVEPGSFGQDACCPLHRVVPSALTSSSRRGHGPPRGFPRRRNAHRDAAWSGCFQLARAPCPFPIHYLQAYTVPLSQPSTKKWPSPMHSADIRNLQSRHPSLPQDSLRTDSR